MNTKKLAIVPDLITFLNCQYLSKAHHFLQGKLSYMVKLYSDTTMGSNYFFDAFGGLSK